LGARCPGIARTGSPLKRAQRYPYGSYHRLAIGQDHRQRGARGYDAGKKIKGRKRHIAVDTQGNLLTVVVHSAGIQDRVGARAVLTRLFRRFDTLVKIFADGGYTGTLIDWAKAMFGYDVEVVKRNEMHTFKILPKRWIVERSFAWMGCSRRLSKDYELCPASAESMTWISFTHTLLRRLA
jgi:transposase